MWMIAEMIVIPNRTSSAWDRPCQGQLRNFSHILRPAICNKPLSIAKPIIVEQECDWSLPPKNHHSP